MLKALICDDAPDTNSSPKAHKSKEISRTKQSENLENKERHKFENAAEMHNHTPVISLENEEGNIEFNFEDPYVNLPTPSVNQNLKIEKILNKLDNFMKKAQSESKLQKYEDNKLKEDSESIALNLHSGFEHHYSGISRDLNDSRNKNIWRKSYELLDKINIERSNRLYKYKLDSLTNNSIFSKSIINDLSLYKKDVKYSNRSKSRQENEDKFDRKVTFENSQSRSNPKQNLEEVTPNSRNAMQRNKTEVNILKPANSMSQFVFKNREIADEMFRLINPKTIQTSYFFN